MKSPLREALLTGVLSLSLVPIAYGANPASTNTTTAQGLEVSITAPAGPVLIDGSAINASATATLGAPPPVPVNVLYITDLSGSMLVSTPPHSPSVDCNHDGLHNRLDDACFGLIALNQAMGSATNVDIGMIGFGRYAVNADMDPATGVQLFTGPANADKNGDGTPDVEQVIAGMHPLPTGNSEAFTLFTAVPQYTVGTSTDYEQALDRMNQAFSSQPAGEINIAAFISDGEPTSGDYHSALLAAQQAGTTVYTFAVGPTAANECQLDKPLGIIASDTGGACTVVTDTSTLQSILPAILTTRIQSLNLKVNGTVVASNGGSEPSTMSLGTVDLQSYLTTGSNLITSTAVAEDGTTVTADVALEAHRLIPVQIDIRPGSDQNPINLGSKGVVTAVVFGSQDFDVMDIVADTVKLANASIAARKNGTLMMDYQDVNGDGNVDLVAKFRTQDLGLSANDTSAVLTGKTVNGDTAQGSDSVRIVP